MRMFKKKWTVVRVMATAKGELPAVYFPTHKWFWTKYFALKLALEMGDIAYRRNPVQVVADMMHGTGWFPVSRKTLETMKNYKEV
jgi:hypothetical protein